MKQWIWGMLINIYTKIIKWKADRDCIMDSSGWQYVIRNRHDTLHACCKKISAYVYKILYREERSIRNGTGRNSSQIRLHHNYSFTLTIFGENLKSEVHGVGGAVCNCHLPSNRHSPSTKAPTRNICQRPTDMARLFHILFFSGKLCLSHDIP